jgi:hypothetical protein
MIVAKRGDELIVGRHDGLTTQDAADEATGRALVVREVVGLDLDEVCGQALFEQPDLGLFAAGVKDPPRR